MADDRTPADEETPQEPGAGEEQPVQEPAAEQPAAAEQPGVEEPAAAEQPAAPAPQEPVAEAPAEEAPAAAPAPQEPAAAEPVAQQPAAAEPVAADEDEDEEELTPRVKPEIPGADLEVDIVMEGAERGESPYDEDDDGESSGEDSDDVPDDQPIAAVTIDLAAGARYSATGKRKTAVARVILKPGTGAYTINGRTLDEFFPRSPLQRNIRQPLEAVGYETRMDVVARMHGGGVSSQAGALRHGISRALLEADPNLRGELKRRGFLTRDPRVKERKKAGLKKARKRPQFSKR
jgi:small subunit ribosomal protein S9